MGIISEYYRKSKESKKEEEEAAKKEYAASHPISAFYQSAASNSKLHTASAGESNKDFVARTLREDTNITNRLAERRTAEKNEAFKKTEANSEDANKRSVLNSAWNEAASRGEVNTPVPQIPVPRLGESKYVSQANSLMPAYSVATVLENKKRNAEATRTANEEEAEERRIAEKASIDKRLANQNVQAAMQNTLDVTAAPTARKNYTDERLKQAGIIKRSVEAAKHISNDELLKEYGLTPEEFTAAKQKYGAKETVLPGITRPYTPYEKKQENYEAVSRLNREVSALEDQYEAASKMLSASGIKKAEQIRSEITAKKEKIESLRNEQYNGLDTIAETEKKEADAKKSNASVGTKVAASAVYVPASVGMGTDSALKNIVTGGKTTLGDAFTDGAYSKGYKAIEDYFANTGESAASYINRALTSGAYRTNDPYGQLAQDISNMTGVRKDVVENYIATGESNRMYDALGKDVPEWFKNSVGKQAYMIGQQLPGILLTAGAATGEEAISAFAESFSKAASVSLVGASVYGDTVNRNAKEHGYSGSNYLNAALQGAIEMWTEYMFGFTDAKSYLDFFEPTGDMGQSVWKGMLKYLADGGEEGLEELVNEPLSELADRLTGISNNTNIVGKGGIFDFEQMIASGVDGAIGGLIMGGVGVLASLRSASAKSMSIRDQFNQAEDVANRLPNSYKPQNRPTSYADMTQEIVDSYEAEVLEGYMRYLEDSSSGDFGDFENSDAGKSNVRQKNIASVKNLLGADDPTSLLTVTKFAKSISDTMPGDDAVNGTIDFIKNELHERIYSDQDAETLRDVVSVLRNQRKAINSELATTAVSSVDNELETKPVAEKAQPASQNTTTPAETLEPVAAENVSEAGTASVTEQDVVRTAHPASTLNEYLEDNGADTSMTAAQKAKKLAYNSDSIFHTVIDLDKIAQKDSASVDAVKELKHELALINAPTVAKTVERYNSVLSKNGITVKVATEEQTHARDHGWYNAKEKAIYISPYMSNTAAIGATVVHEYTHRGADADMSLVNDILKVRDSAVAKGLYDARISDEVDSAYAEDVRDMNDEQKTAYLNEEKAAHFLEHIMNDDKALREFVSEDRSLVRRIADAIADFVDRVFGRADSAEARQARRTVEKLRGIVEETAQKVESAPDKSGAKTETTETTSAPVTESYAETAAEPAAESNTETPETAEPSAVKRDIRALAKGTGNAENAAVKLMDEYSGNADAAIADVLASDLKQSTKDQIVNAIAAEASNRQVGVSPDTEVRASRELDSKLMDNAVEKAQTTEMRKMLGMVRAQRAEIKSILDAKQDALNLPPDIAGNTFYTDSSYGGSMENSSVCIRSLAADAMLDYVATELGRPLTVDETFDIAQKMMEFTDHPECLYCYVAMDRKAYREYLGNYLSEMRNAVADIQSGTDSETAYKTFLRGRADTANMRYRFSMFEELAKSGNIIEAKDLASIDALMNESDALTNELIDFVAKKNGIDPGKIFVKQGESTDKSQRGFPVFAYKKKGKDIVLTDIRSLLNNPETSETARRYQQLFDAMNYAQGASWAKKRVSYAAYDGTILRFTNEKVKSLNNDYGLRMYSFSDFSPAFILENMQMVTDAAVRGLKVLAYTKELDFVRIFADTGMNINISVFPTESKDANGNFACDGMQGAEWSEARELRGKYKDGNVGITMVCTNDEQVEWALKQDWVDVVIPFHLVRTGAKAAEKQGWSNYTAESSDTKLPGWVKNKDVAHITPPMHQNNMDKYLAACAANHLEPRFKRWLDNPNYMKLVNETRRSAGETPAVTPNFTAENMAAARQSIDNLEKSGGYNRPIGLYEENAKDIAKEIADSIRDGSLSTSSIDPEARASLEQGKAPVVRKSKELEDIYQETLSDNFLKWFGDWVDHPENASVVVNEDGTPKVMYHGTNSGGFNIFDSYAGNYGLFGIGSYFTDNKDVAEEYSRVKRRGRFGEQKVYSVYLNIRNPLDMDAKADVPLWIDQLNSIDEVTDGNYGFDLNEFKDKQTNEEMYRELERQVGDLYFGESKYEFYEDMQSIISAMGYDGITHIGGGRVKKDGVMHRVYIVFEPNQIKSATDNIGTFDPNDSDIRYSRELLTPEERAVRDAEDRTKRLEERNEYLRKQLTLTHTASGAAKVISPAKRRDIASSIATDIPGITIADADAQIKTVYDILEQPKRGAKDTAEVRYKEASEAAQKAAEWLVDNAFELQENPAFYQNEEVRRFLRRTPIRLNISKSEWGDEESYRKWRHNNLTLLRISPQEYVDGSKTRGIDSVYKEAAGQFPEYFDPDETDMYKMILRLGEVASELRDTSANSKTIRVNPYADVKESLVSQIANRIMWEYADKAELTKAAKQAYAQQMNEQDVRQAYAEGQRDLENAVVSSYERGVDAGKDAMSAAASERAALMEYHPKNDNAEFMRQTTKMAQKQYDYEMQRFDLMRLNMEKDLKETVRNAQKAVEKANRDAERMAERLASKDVSMQTALNAKRFLNNTKRLYNRLSNPNKNTHVDDNLQAAVADALKTVQNIKFTDGSQMDGFLLEKIAAEATRGEAEDSGIRNIVGSYTDAIAEAQRKYGNLSKRLQTLNNQIGEMSESGQLPKAGTDERIRYDNELASLQWHKKQTEMERKTALSSYYRTAGDMMELINDYVRKADEIFIDGKKQTAKDFADQLIADLELRHGVNEDKELRDMYDELKAMKESRGQSGIDDAQLDKDIQNQLDKIAKKKAENGWKATSNADKRSLARQIHYESCAPSTFFSMMGDTGTMMDRRIRAAQNKQAKLEQKYVDAIRKATNGKYSTWKAGGYGNNRIMIELPGGVDSDYVKVDVSKAQLMSLYELWKRPAARRHLEQQGACFLTVRGNQMQERTFAISESTMKKLTSYLTEEDIRVADAVQEFLATDCADAGNEASMEMYNYKLFGDPNYFPIQVTDAVKLKNAPGFGADSRTFNLENLGMTKRIAANASGAIVIDDMFNVADRHVKQMAAYSAYAPITNDLRKIMNDDRVMKVIEERMGKEANEYLDNFFNQLSNPLATGKDGVSSYWIFDAVGNVAKRAAVLGNVSTALKQPLSIFRAMSEINPKYIAEAYKSTAKNPLAFRKGGNGNGEYARIYNTMVENSGIAKMKMDGFSDTGFAKEMRNLYDDDFVNGGGGLRGMANANKVTRKILKGYDALSDAGAWMTGKGDEATWVQLWRACELESAEKYSDLSDEEQLKKTTEHFNEIIGRTQVVDSILDNAPLKGKLQNSVRGALGVFMNEPIKTYSNLLTAIDGIRNGRPGAKKQFAATAAASAVGSLIMEPLVSVMMSLIRNERDDRDDFGKQMLSKLFGIDVTDNGDGTSVISVASSEAVTSAVGFLNPYVGEIYELILDAINGYSGEDMATQAINDFVTATTNLADDEKAKYKTTLRKTLDWVDALSVLTGLGGKNIRRELRSIVWNVMSVTNSYEAQWEYLKLNYELGENTARQKKGYYDVLAKAYKAGDTEAYKRFREELKGYGIDSDKIADEIDARGGNIYGVNDGELYYIDLQSRWGIDGDPGNYAAEKIVSDVRNRSSDPAGFYYDAPKKKYSKKDSDGNTVTMTEDEHLDFIDYSGKLARKLTIDLSKAKGWNDLTADQQVSACEKAWEYAKIAGRVRWVDTKDGVTYKFPNKWQETAYRGQQSGSEIAAVIIKNTKQYNKDDEADEEDEEE